MLALGFWTAGLLLCVGLAWWGVRGVFTARGLYLRHLLATLVGVLGGYGSLFAVFALAFDKLLA